MLIVAYNTLRHALPLTTAFWAFAATACNVPVFRYALERWEADPYDVVVFHRGPLAADQLALFKKLEKAVTDGRVNLEAIKVNLPDEVPLPIQPFWQSQAKPELPWMVLRYPRKAGIEPAAWAGRFHAEAVESLLESPARRDIVQKLSSGDLVWLLLESGDQPSDEKTFRFVEAELRKLEEILVLPEQTAQDLPVNPDLPLKIAFSTVRLPRADPAERAFVNVLLNWNTNLPAVTETMLFPIFGRGRVVSPAIGAQITAEAIRDMAEFLTGPCSCEIKEMNPGYDLLMTANWSSFSGYQEVMVPEPPPLVGLSQFVADATNSPASSPNPPAVALSSAGQAPGAAGSSRLLRNVVVLLGAAVGFLAAATLVLRAKAGRPPGSGVS
jgi:hypothetical protein